MPGTITKFEVPAGPGVRVETYLRAGSRISPYYDSLVAKVVVHGQDREEAVARAKRALDEFVIEGIATTIPFHKRVLENEVFLAGRPLPTLSKPRWEMYYEQRSERRRHVAGARAWWRPSSPSPRTRLKASPRSAPLPRAAFAPNSWRNPRRRALKPCSTPREAQVVLHIEGVSRPGSPRSRRKASRGGCRRAARAGGHRGCLRRHFRRRHSIRSVARSHAPVL